MTYAVATTTGIASPVAMGLRALQSDATVLHFKLRSYHWNVSGKGFFHLHQLFERLYVETAEVEDSLAERLLAIGTPPIATLSEQLHTSRLQEDHVPDPAKMVRNILADLEKFTGFLRELAREAGHVQDVATMNLADSFADKNEKTIWMLRAYLKQN